MPGLEKSSSAFLRQAANSPIDWWPWSEEAFEKARREDKPVLVDVGASWCHWCHVMDETTYSDPEIAEVVNKEFVAIKVDRDEMPDLDRELQMAVQTISNESGWPLTVFMTPDRKVFFGGTYFPPKDVVGRPGMKKVLFYVLKLWKEQRDRVNEVSEGLRRAIEEWKSQSIGLADYDSLEALMNQVASSYDLEYGGLGNSMKFPHPTVDEALLEHSFLTNDDLGRKYAVHTLKMMGRGGVFDQVGGGFHRYAIDRDWGTPHFEKLLIDNAELLRDLIEAYSLTHEEELLFLAEMTVGSVKTYFWKGESYYNSIDADSEGVEGGFYTWDYDELLRLLGENWAKVFVHRAKRVEGRVVLRRIGWRQEIAKATGVPEEVAIDELRKRIEKLRELRDDNRKLPFRDENEYSNAHCLMAYSLIDADFLFGGLRGYYEPVVNKVMNGRPGRTLTSGREPLPEDLASCSLLLFKAFSARGDRRLLEAGIRLAQELEGLVESTNSSDNPNESPRSLVTKALTASRIYQGLEPDQSWFKLMPFEPTFQAGLIGLGALVAKRAWAHVVVIDEGDGAFEALLRSAFLTYHPFKLIEPVGQAEEVPRSVREMARYAERKSKAFVCTGKSCSTPLYTPEALARTLSMAR
ncbi:MAG: thioredoxin domain-containing protein [Sulfolobales archaeon]|nr:thioredoxin domain-containing protein [Sulfolobales archaeon]